MGSSPRMRGARDLIQRYRASLRIIPADAGSTNYDAFMYSDTEDHPRGCGEHHSLANKTDIAQGSSPRMRGAPREWKGFMPTAGIIPADAGSTRRPRSSILPSWDHPRGCGEHNPYHP